MTASMMKFAFIAALPLAGSFVSQGGGLAFVASLPAFKPQPICSKPSVADRTP